MSLATRCTACGTIFRVVQDQLKVSEGWVRCGRCHEVFNALEGLFDLEREAPPQRTVQQKATASESGAEASASPSSPSTAAGKQEWDSTQAQQSSDYPEEDDLPSTHEDDALDSRFLRRESAIAEARESGHADFADAQFPSELPEESAGEPELPPSPSPAGLAYKSRSGELQLAPNFVRHADRAARWKSPRVRVLLSLLLLLLVGMLAGQIAYQWRDLLAAELPASRPYLARLCDELGCRLQAPRRVDDLAVESSALTKVNGSGEVYRLSVVLRNRGRFGVALPAVELSLTDANGALLVRRALSPADFRAKETELAAGAEAPLQLLLTVPDQQVAGYTVEIFYP